MDSDFQKDMAEKLSQMGLYNAGDPYDPQYNATYKRNYEPDLRKPGESDDSTE